MGERDAKKLRESSESNGESNMSRREWLKTFSTMKVRPPKNTNLWPDQDMVPQVPDWPVKG